MQATFSTRRDRLRRLLHQHSLDAYLVLLPANRYYLSGFELHDPQCNESAGCLIITAQGEDILCTDSRYYRAALKLWPEENLFIYKNNRVQDLAKFMAGKEFGRIGFESRGMSHELFEALQESTSLFPCKQGLTEELRLIKDEWEISRLADSCRLNHSVFGQTPSLLQAGSSEIELAWSLEKHFRENGASELAFPSIVAVGPNAALPHHIPGPDEVEGGRPVLIDMGGRLNAYCSDQSRTFWVGGQPPDYFQKTLELVQEAQRQAIEAVRPGLVISQLFKVVFDFFSRHGVEKHFTHALGHGIGLETHEAPSLGPRNENRLQEGSVITVEPGLYFPEWGGVRWEHMIVVREDGAETL